MRKIAAIVSSVIFSLVLLAAPVSADEPNATCSVGEDGVCVAISKKKSVKKVRIRNNARVRSTTFAVVVSGGNEQKFVDDNNTLTTGEATATAESSNVVNESNVEIH